jgi:hypothetical protein
MPTAPSLCLVSISFLRRKYDICLLIASYYPNIHSLMTPWPKLSHKQVVTGNWTVPLGFLISVPKALRILLIHKIRDTRFQLFLVRCVCAFFAVLSLGIWAFNLLPMFLAVVVSALGIGLYTFLFYIGVGDILLIFAFEDGPFFEMATGCQALNIFEDTEPSLPQPPDLVCGSGKRRASRFDRLAKKRFCLPSVRRFPSRPRTHPGTHPGLSDRRTGR